MNTLMEKVRSHRDSILMVAMSIKPDNKGFLSLNIFSLLQRIMLIFPIFIYNAKYL